MERFDYKPHGDNAERRADGRTNNNGSTRGLPLLLGNRSAHTQQHVMTNIIIQRLPAKAKCRAEPRDCDLTRTIASAGLLPFLR
ncbi:MAG: hypothetical protein CMP96_11520 [Gammaproteobacteria bacterium]|nr:hypothetical protein [Gammaproteobacteria bacterium]